MNEDLRKIAEDTYDNDVKETEAQTNQTTQTKPDNTAEEGVEGRVSTEVEATAKQNDELSDAFNTPENKDTSDTGSDKLKSDGEDKQEKEEDENKTPPLPKSIKKSFESLWEKIDPQLSSELATRINADDSVIKSFKEEKQKREVTLSPVKSYLKYIADIDGIGLDEANRNIVNFVQNINDNPDSLADLIGTQINPKDAVTFVKRIANNLRIDLSDLSDIADDDEIALLKYHYLEENARKARQQRQNIYNSDNDSDGEISNLRDIFMFEERHKDFLTNLENDATELARFQKFVEIASMDRNITPLEQLEVAFSYMQTNKNAENAKKTQPDSEQPDATEQRRTQVQKAQKFNVSLKNTASLGGQSKQNNKTLREIILDAWEGDSY